MEYAIVLIAVVAVIATGVIIYMKKNTAFDAGIERIAYSRAKMSYMPNIYVLGKDGV